MVDIVSTLARVRAARDTITAAIRAKGVTVPAGAGFEDFPGLIAKITGNGADPDLPALPSDYLLIGDYNTSMEWEAPEKGYYKMEIFGASGNGGSAVGTVINSAYHVASGSAGGGGAYSLSEGVALNAGDIVSCAVGADGTITITANSTVEGVGVIAMSCTKGADGVSATKNGNTIVNGNAAGGAGGVASGGITANLNGGNGSKSVYVAGVTKYENAVVAAAAGGAAGHADGNAGGASGSAQYTGTNSCKTGNPETGKGGFFRLYRGDTNSIVPDFPEEPESTDDYTLIDTYTTTQEWTAPEDGWYKVEVYGASGRGGYAVYDPGEEDVGGEEPESVSGGGGGSGGYALSVVKLNVGDVVGITPGAVGTTTTVTVDSTNDDSYDHTITITSGKNGGNGTHNMVSDPGDGGAGGVASGGLDVNTNGNSGKNGTNPDGSNAAGGAGGAAVVTGGNAGGAGASVSSAKPGSPGSGKAGFVKISRGNTNIVA